jgi:hypothetical protein
LKNGEGATLEVLCLRNKIQIEKINLEKQVTKRVGYQNMGQMQKNVQKLSLNVFRRLKIVIFHLPKMFLIRWCNLTGFSCMGEIFYFEKSNSIHEKPIKLLLSEKHNSSRFLNIKLVTFRKKKSFQQFYPLFSIFF